ncbi:MAG: homogentisate 1,2-dioxygenase [Gammaproteobacteria bacterium]
MKNYIPISKVVGQSSRQAHVDLPQDTYEREIGKDGFFGPATHMYHRHPPTGWSDWQGNLRPRLFDLAGKLPAAASPWHVPDILFNRHCRLRYWKLEKSMPRLARNGDGDDLMFVHRGSGSFLCDYGRLTLSAGDYVIIPRSTTWRLETESPMEMLMIEASGGSYYLPDRGLLGKHAFFDPAMLDAPAIDEAFIAQQKTAGDWQIELRARGSINVITYPFNPLDAVGWHGDLSVARINVRDFRPLNSHRYHLPPSAHTTFVAERFVICTFVPRPFETDPEAIKIPFFHNNDDYDEVLFYHDGDFFSRDNIEAGMLTLHPCGFTHGPHPKALKKLFHQEKKMSDEYAVMVDARDPMTVADLPTGVENLDYVHSWGGDS